MVISISIIILKPGYPPQYLAFTTASPPYHIRSTNQINHQPELHQNHQQELHQKHQGPPSQLHQLPQSSKLQHLNNSNQSASQLHLPSLGSHQPYLGSTQPYLGSKPPSSQPYGKPPSSQAYHKNFHLMQSQTLPRLGGGQIFPQR